MNISASIVERLSSMVRLRNRELAFDAVLKALLGMLFTLVTFGMLFWIGWYFGVFVGRYLNLNAWQFGAILTGVFFVVATWSASARVNPLAGLKPLTDQQLLLTLVSHAMPNFLYFSPRHATAGAAILLLGGPANVIEAFGIWAHRIRADAVLLEEASRLLEMCKASCPVEQVQSLAAAILLRRLALIKAVTHGEAPALTLTEKGRTTLSGGKAGKKRGQS